MKILIIGGGNSGENFCKGILLNSEYEITLTSLRNEGKTKKLSEKYYLNFQLFEHVCSDLKNFNLIIVCTPLGTKFDIFETILSFGYRGKFILEKPITTDFIKLKKYNNLIEKYSLKVFIAYSRRYYTWSYTKTDCYKIVYPIKSFENTVLHNLPHILDVIYVITDKKFTLKAIKVSRSENEIKITLESFQIQIQLVLPIVDTMQMPMTINNNIVPFPRLNVFYDMVNDILNENYKDNLFDLEREIFILRLLKRIEDCL